MAEELPVPVHFRVAARGTANPGSESRSDALFGWIHRPQGMIGTGTGVILCDPFGAEQNCIYRTYRQLAGRLASEGCYVMRFDYYGAGNSAGSDGEPGLVRAWLDSIHAAIETLTEAGGLKEIILFGTKLGATLAAAAAAERPPGSIKGLVLWSPFENGGDFCRETLFAKKLSARSGAAHISSEQAPPPAKDADHEINGFLLTPSTMVDLRQVDLLATSSPPAARCLVLARRATLTESRLVGHFRALGVETLHEFIPGLAETLVAPDQCVVPADVIERVSSWIRESGISESTGPGPAIKGVRTLGTVGLDAPVAIDDAVCETPVRFGRGGRVFGILSEPRHAAKTSRRPAIVLINPGAVHHAGANRLHVVMARQCAAAGYPVMRFDFSGLGDSPPAENSAENAVSMREAVLEDERRGIVTKDIIDAMNAVQEARGVERFVLFGNCSAGRMAFHAAVRDKRVIGAQIINTPYFDVQDLLQTERAAFGSLTHYRQVLSRPEAWTRVLKGQVDFGRAIGVIRTQAVRAMRYRGMRAKVLGRRLGWNQSGVDKAQAPAPMARSPVNDICDDFIALSKRGVHPMLIYTPDDVGIGYTRGLLGDTLEELGINVEIVPGADHDFSYRAARVLLMGRLTEYLDRLA